MEKCEKQSYLPPFAICLASLLMILAALPSAFGYELKLYHPAATVLTAAAAEAVSAIALLFRKKRMSGAGLMAVWMAPFLAALSMAGWAKTGGAAGIVIGICCLLLTQAALWRCVDSKQLRIAVSCTVIGLIAAGILIAWLMDVWRIRSDVLDEVVFGLLFVGAYLLPGALLMLGGISEKRSGKTVSILFALPAVLILIGMMFLTHAAFASRKVVVLQSVISPEGKLIAEEYTVGDGAEGSIRVRENSDGLHVLIGRLYRNPRSVYWHYGSANVETLAWRDEDTLLINGEAWPWREFRD